MIEKYFEGKVPSLPEGAFEKGSAIDTAREAQLMRLVAEGTKGEYDAAMERLRFSHALGKVWAIISDANRCIEETAPWTLWKEGKKEKLAVTLYTLAESLRIVAVYLSPFIPHTAQEMWRQLGSEADITSLSMEDALRWGGLKAGTKVTKGPSLFPKVEAPLPKNEPPTPKVEADV